MADAAALWSAFELITANFSEPERQLLFHDNSVRLYRLR